MLCGDSPHDRGLHTTSMGMSEHDFQWTEQVVVRGNLYAGHNVASVPLTFWISLGRCVYGLGPASRCKYWVWVTKRGCAHNTDSGSQSLNEVDDSSSPQYRCGLILDEVDNEDQSIVSISDCIVQAPCVGGVDRK